MDIWIEGIQYRPFIHDEVHKVEKHGHISIRNIRRQNRYVKFRRRWVFAVGRWGGSHIQVQNFERRYHVFK